MEIGALSSALATGYVPRATSAETVDRARQPARDPAEVPRARERASSNASETTANNATEARRKEARELQPEKASTPVPSPRVQFKDAEGTRVMEVYDSKNILIYQVPPKGALTLIHSQESNVNFQVETSA